MPANQDQTADSNVLLQVASLDRAHKALSGRGVRSRDSIGLSRRQVDYAKRLVLGLGPVDGAVAPVGLYTITRGARERGLLHPDQLETSVSGQSWLLWAQPSLGDEIVVTEPNMPRPPDRTRPNATTGRACEARWPRGAARHE